MNDLRQRLPFEGLRVVEVGEVWAGPLTGSMMGDLGAEVIKIETLRRSTRGQLRPPPAAPGYPDGDPGDEPWNRSSTFNAINRNKQSVTLDLATGSGRAVFDRLLAVADILVTNISASAQDKLALDPERVRATNPELIVAYLTGFGRSGPYRDYRSMGMTIDAIAGHSALRGHPDLDLSTSTPVHHPDAIAVATAVFTLSLALIRRERTGEGTIIDQSQLESMLPHLGEYLIAAQMDVGDLAPIGNAHPWMSPHGCFEAREPDTWLTVAVDSDEAWRALCSVMGRDDLVGDKRFASVRGRAAHRPMLNRAVAAWVSGQERFRAERTLQAVGVPAAAVQRADVDQLANTVLFDRGAQDVMETPHVGSRVMPRGPWHLRTTVPVPAVPAPSLGEHNKQVLQGLLGMSDEEVAALEAAGIVGTVPRGSERDPAPREGDAD